jgi:hypothetical protein
VSILGDLVKNLDISAVQQLAVKNFNQCQFSECDKFSIGFQCVSCSTFVCNTHLYFKLGTPPVPFCVKCILSNESQDVCDG